MPPSPQTVRDDAPIAPEKGTLMTITPNPDFNRILDNFYDYLCGILKLYEDMLPILKEELKAISLDDTLSLDKSLITQQTLLYQTKHFDREIAGYTSKLDLEESNLSSLILQMPEEQQLRFYALLGRFAAIVEEVSFYKDKCRVLLQSRLYSIDKALMEQTGRVENITYDRNASEVHTTFRKSFHTTI